MVSGNANEAILMNIKTMGFVEEWSREKYEI
jgi:hypothetical protein